LLVVFEKDVPLKVYPVQSAATAATAISRLRPNDRQEVAGVLSGQEVTAPRPRSDRDGDGIPDPLDILIGGKKTVLNQAAYGAGYIKLAYPGGDVPRHIGVCTDVVIRAVRNAGIDLQEELQKDIRRHPRRYPMITGRGNPHIDHRRVKTLLPFFKAHWQSRATAVDSTNDPVRPGDILFMDTFPARPGPDHIGIASNVLGESGMPLVINNWTDGSRTAELDLLSWVPVTHRYRAPPR